MAFSKIKTDSVAYNELGIQIEGAYTYLCDNKTDIDDLNNQIVEGKLNIPVGSKALAIEEGEMYIKAPCGEFKKYAGQAIITE